LVKPVALDYLVVDIEALLRDEWHAMGAMRDAITQRRWELTRGLMDLP
jgi:hypothetical protein